MASLHSAYCKCGFDSSVFVGGNRETFLSLSFFPFYCKSCGLVTVNIHADKILCPHCNEKNIYPYGLPPISIGKMNENDYPVIQCFRYYAYATGNLCPSCKKMSLAFGHADALFD